MIVDHERFRNITGGIQSATLTIAVIVGGVWTAWVFNARFEAETARMRFDKEQRELQGRAALSFDMATQVLRDKNVDRFIIATITAENKGTRDIAVSYEGRTPVVATPITWSASGVPVFGDPVAGSDYVVQTSGAVTRNVGWIIRASNRSQIRACLKVPNSGLYLVSFAAQYGARELEESRSLLPSQGGKTRRQYSRSDYVLVE